MSAQPGPQKVTAWLVMKAGEGFGSYSQGPYSGERRVGKIRVVRSVQGKPDLKDDEIAFKLEIDVDESWFLNGTATIQASIPAAPTSSQVVAATVDMPVKGRGKSAAAAVVRP